MWCWVGPSPAGKTASWVASAMAVMREVGVAREPSCSTRAAPPCPLTGVCVLAWEPPTSDFCRPHGGKVRYEERLLRC